MGHWGVRSYENDAAADALDAGLERVHGARYEELMDDRNPLTPEQVQEQLTNAETLAAALAAFEEEWGEDPADWEDEERLAYAGVVVRHAELGVTVPAEILLRVLEWLRAEELDWETEQTKRRLRRDREIGLLEQAAGEAPR